MNNTNTISRLPPVATPKYEITVPSLSQTIEMRPFLVGEEKILLMALESGDPNQMLAAVRQIIHNCSFGVLDSDVLTIFDLEYIFFKLRAHSKGEVVETPVVCRNLVLDQTGKQIECGKPFSLTFNIDNVELTTDPNHSKEINISNKVKIIMKYPDAKTFITKNFSDKQQTLADLFKIILECIKEIHVDGQVFLRENLQPEELIIWMEGLTQDQFAAFSNFFATMPRLRVGINYTCPCGAYSGKTELEGLKSFLG